VTDGVQEAITDVNLSLIDWENWWW